MDINNHIKKIQEFVPGQMNEKEQKLVLSTFEASLYVIKELKETVQTLKDEVNRLKGEQGKPDIAAKNQKETKGKDEDKDKEDKDKGEIKAEDIDIPVSPNQDISSEKERRRKKGKRKKRKVKFDGNQAIKTTHTLDVKNKVALPEDIVFKGYATSHYYDLKIESELIAVRRAIYYSASSQKTYTAELPEEYEAGHDYTQELKGHILMFKFEMGLSIPKIGNFLRMNGVDISNGSISNIILSAGAYFKEEKVAIHRNGMEAGLYSQSDTTGSRVNGENHHTHIVGNEYYSAYFTTAKKDRQTIMDILRCDAPRAYLSIERGYF